MDTEELDRHEREQQTLPCPFAKTLFALRCQCTLARKQLIAHREILQCTQLEPHLRCQVLLLYAGEKAQFTFSRRDPQQPYTHRQQMRLQAAVLATLAREIHGSDDVSRLDLDQLLADALTRYHRLEDFPYPLILRTLAK